MSPENKNNTYVTNQMMIAIPEFVLGTTGLIDTVAVGKLLINGVPEKQIIERFVEANNDFPIPGIDTIYIWADALGVSLPISVAAVGLASVLAVSDAFRRFSKIKQR